MGQPQHTTSHLIGFKKSGGDDPPEIKARQDALNKGHPEAAAQEMLQMQKSCLLATGGAVTMLSLNTPEGQTMVGPEFNQPLVRATKKAVTYAQELDASRVSGGCAGWLIPKDLPGPVGGRNWRKAHRRGRQPALIGFCLDREQGAAIAYAQVHEVRGKPVGFSSPASHLTPEVSADAFQALAAPLTAKPQAPPKVTYGQGFKLVG